MLTETEQKILNKLIELTNRYIYEQGLAIFPAIFKIAIRIYNVNYSQKMYIKLLYHYKKWIDSQSNIQLSQLDGLTVALPTQPPPTALNGDPLLDKGGQSPHEQNSNSLPPNSTYFYRNQAIEILDKTKMLNEQKSERIHNLFENYLNYIDSKAILLIHQDRDKILVLGWNTRFNDEKRQKYELKKYAHAWKTATEQFHHAVFLTLTTDPKQFPALSYANKHISTAFNTFMSWVKKRLGFRPKYIKVLEFTKTGLAHLHIVLFGIHYLADIRQISEEWERTGQGKIAYIYKLENRNGKWIWAKARPKKTHEQIQNYLKKYLLKSMSSNASAQISLYWALNMRFMTMSRALLLHQIRITTGEWEYWKIIDYLMLFEEVPAYIELIDYGS